jgi:hypothetical protein
LKTADPQASAAILGDIGSVAKEPTPQPADANPANARSLDALLDAIGQLTPDALKALRERLRV